MRRRKTNKGSPRYNELGFRNFLANFLNLYEPYFEPNIKLTLTAEELDKEISGKESYDLDVQYGYNWNYGHEKLVEVIKADPILVNLILAAGATSLAPNAGEIKIDGKWGEQAENFMDWAGRAEYRKQLEKEAQQQRKDDEKRKRDKKARLAREKAASKPKAKKPAAKKAKSKKK